MFGTLGFSEIRPPLALTRLSFLRILKEFLDIPQAFLWVPKGFPRILKDSNGITKWFSFSFLYPPSPCWRHLSRNFYYPPVNPELYYPWGINITRQRLLFGTTPTYLDSEKLWYLKRVFFRSCCMGLNHVCFSPLIGKNLTVFKLGACGRSTTFRLPTFRG